MCRMIHSVATITSLSSIAFHTYVLRFRDGDIARSAQPGQFLNIKVGDAYEPLLRRPYSISQVDDGIVSIMFEVVGKGTTILSQKKLGDALDIIGPLGRGFDLEGDFESALLVAGGIGAAPFPFLCKELKKKSKAILSFVGARKSNQLVTLGLDNSVLATDDGSVGFHGTVVECLRDYLAQHQVLQPRIFACGPNEMLKALAEFTKQARIQCTVSLESQMACGIGICQGCAVESTNAEKKYCLVCKDGPVFDATSILL